MGRPASRLRYCRHVAVSATLRNASWGLGPDAASHRLLQSTSGAWTDAPSRRALGTGWAELPYGFLSIEPRNWVIWGGTQLARATLWTVRKGRKIKGFPLTRRKQAGDVVQLVRTLPCHGRGRGFESRRPRHSFEWFTENPKNNLGPSGSKKFFEPLLISILLPSKQPEERHRELVDQV